MKKFILAFAVFMACVFPNYNSFADDNNSYIEKVRAWAEARKELRRLEINKARFLTNAERKSPSEQSELEKLELKIRHFKERIANYNNLDESTKTMDDRMASGDARRRLRTLERTKMRLLEVAKNKPASEQTPIEQNELQIVAQKRRVDKLDNQLSAHEGSNRCNQFNAQDKNLLRKAATANTQTIQAEDSDQNETKKVLIAILKGQRSGIQDLRSISDTLNKTTAMSFTERRRILDLIKHNNDCAADAAEDPNVLEKFVSLFSSPNSSDEKAKTESETRGPKYVEANESGRANRAPEAEAAATTETLGR